MARRFYPTARKKAREIGRPSPPWMITYADLVTQLLIFFVMFFALAPALNELQLIRIKNKLEEYISQNNLQEVIGLEINEKGLVVSIREKIMFDRGKADIYPEAKKILSDITAQLKNEPNWIRIEGHTCDLPISTPQFPSNWELSTARATNVSKYLIEVLGFPPERISAGGYGEYHPVVENIDEAHRSLNRRVDIVISRLKSGETSPLQKPS